MVRNGQFCDKIEYAKKIGKFKKGQDFFFSIVGL